MTTKRNKLNRNRYDRKLVSTNIREELLVALETQIKGFADIVWISKSKTYNTIKDIKYNLIQIVLLEYNGWRKKHNMDERYSSFSSKYLQGELGVHYEKMMAMFFVKYHPNTKTSMVREKTTLKYKLKKEIIEICDKVYLGEYKLHGVITRGGKKLNTLPEYTIRGRLNGGVVAKNRKNDQFKNYVSLNEDNMVLMLRMWRDLYRNRHGNKSIKIKRWVNILKEVGKDYREISDEGLDRRNKHAIELINNTLVDIVGQGRLLQLYTEKDSGRLYGDEKLNLQTLPREMRYIAMGGMNYYEYDIENCHYSIIYQLNQMWGGKPLDAINRYIKDTKETREAISKETGVDYNIIKTILIDLVYGAGIKQKHRYDKYKGKSFDNSILKTLLEYTNDNRDDAIKLFDTIAGNKRVSKIYDELESARKLLKSKYRIKTIRNKEYLENTIGKITSILDYRGEVRSRGAMLSHITQGIESAALRVILEEEGEYFVMPHHDGWVSMKDNNTDMLEALVRGKTAEMMRNYDGTDGHFSFTITKKKLNDITKGDWAEKITSRKTIKEMMGVN